MDLSFASKHVIKTVDPDTLLAFQYWPFEKTKWKPAIGKNWNQVDRQLLVIE